MNTYGEPDVGNLLVRFDEDLREKRLASLSGYSTVLMKTSADPFCTKRAAREKRGEEYKRGGVPAWQD